MYCYTPCFFTSVVKKSILLDGFGGNGAFPNRLLSALIPQYKIL